MKVTVTPAHALSGEGQRLDASYHASPGVQALRTLRDWASASRRYNAGRAAPAARIHRPVMRRGGWIGWRTCA
jgi:hypothetical protein